MTNEEFLESVRLEGEEWRDVVGWEGWYSVSSIGRVVSLGRTIQTKNGKSYRIKHKLLKPNTTNHNGILYNYICFRKGCKKFVYGIHRLVAIAFIPNPNKFPEVDHIDRDGLNNCVDNLRWCNRIANMRNNNTRRVMAISQSKKRLPMLYKPVVQIKDGRVVRVFESITDAAKNGYTMSCIIRACKKQIHTHKGYMWAYLSEYKPIVNQ